MRIKNRTCYYFDDIIRLEDFDFDIILINEKSHENILIYDIDGFIRISDGTRYLVLLDLEKYDAIYFRTRYLLSLNSDFKQ